jgi:hypothetical protein
MMALKERIQAKLAEKEITKAANHIVKAPPL